MKTDRTPFTLTTHLQDGPYRMGVNTASTVKPSRKHMRRISDMQLTLSLDWRGGGTVVLWYATHAVAEARLSAHSSTRRMACTYSGSSSQTFSVFRHRSF